MTWRFSKKFRIACSAALGLAAGDKASNCGIDRSARGTLRA